jgi:hypothetical protein
VPFGELPAATSVSFQATMSALVTLPGSSWPSYFFNARM